MKWLAFSHLEMFQVTLDLSLLECPGDGDFPKLFISEKKKKVNSVGLKLFF